MAPVPATPEQQTIYWSLSVTAIAISVVLQCLVLYEWQHNKAYKKPMFRGFIPMFAGDWAQMLSYGTQHTINLSQGQLYREEAYCSAAAFTGIILNLVLTWFGMVMVAYALRKTVHAALNGDPNKEIITTRVILFGALFPLGYAALYYGVTFNEIGSFRELFCGFVEYDLLTGGIGLIYYFLCGSIIMFFFGNTYYMLDGHFSAMGKGSDTNRSRTINSMISLSAKVFMVFTVCGTGTLLEVLLQTFGVATPIELTMFAGVSYKVKPIADAVMILTMPAVKKNRRDDFLFHGITKEWGRNELTKSPTVTTQSDTAAKTFENSISEDV